MNGKKRLVLLNVIGILVGILTIIGIGYAFYHARSNTSVTNIDLLSDTSDYLTFKNGNKLTINPNQYNLEEGIGDIVSETTATANLKANSYNKNVMATYNAYFKISTNEYIYTNGTTPEIILEITKPDGTKVTSIDGLTYVTISDTLKGFDITTKSGIFILAEDYSIASTNSDEGVNQNWIIKITYRNLDTDQIANEAKTFNAEVLLQKEKYIFSLANITATDVKNKILDDYNAIDNIITTNAVEYRFSGGNDVVNNWVCFGSNEKPCPQNNLYRIIGLFPTDYDNPYEYNYKLIKAYYATEDDLGPANSIENGLYRYTFDESLNFTSTSIFDTFIYNLLNTTYLENLGNWSSLISTGRFIDFIDMPDWYNSATFDLRTATTTYFYNLENDYHYWGNIVWLMNPSDYGYASLGIADLSLAIERYVTCDNWLYLTFDNGGEWQWEWTGLADNSSAFRASFEVSPARSYGWYPVRPVFYLNSEIVLLTGDGSLENVYYIEIE